MKNPIQNHTALVCAKRLTIGHVATAPRAAGIAKNTALKAEDHDHCAGADSHEFATGPTT